MTTISDKLVVLYEQKGLIPKTFNNDDNLLTEGIFENWINDISTSAKLMYHSFKFGDNSPQVIRDLDNYTDKIIDKPETITTLKAAGFSDLRIHISNFLEHLRISMQRTFNPNYDLHTYKILNNVFGIGEAAAVSIIFVFILIITQKLFSKFFKNYAEECKHLKGKEKEECQKKAEVKAYQAEIKELINSKKLANRSDNPQKLKKNIDKRIMKIQKKIEKLQK